MALVHWFSGYTYKKKHYYEMCIRDRQKAHETATGIEHRLKEKFGEDTHVGIHVEPVQ